VLDEYTYSTLVIAYNLRTQFGDIDGKASAICNDHCAFNIEGL